MLKLQENIKLKNSGTVSLVNRAILYVTMSKFDLNINKTLSA